MTQQEVWLRLSAVRKLDVTLACSLAESLLDKGRDSLAALYELPITDEQREMFLHPRQEPLNAALRWLEGEDNHLLVINDIAYPELLRHISSPPLVLFVQGQVDLLSSPQIGMVGSREHSRYGEDWANYFSAGLINSGFTITSGLALGIDGICHRAALESGGKTIAVLGSGLGNIYPRQNSALADDIVQQGGALVSELPIAAPPLREHFPRRNRIISGLSVGVLIIEASLRSGSLITARYALEQGREVFALPSPLGTPTSEGTHWLIQQGAYLVTEPQDIAEHIGSGLTWIAPKKSNIRQKSVSPPAKKAAEEIICVEDAELELPFADVLANVGYEVTPIDVVAERAGQPVSEVVAKLLDLELAGWIAAVSGGYVRIGRAGHVRRINVLI